ncbi:hypothetical protein V6N12_035913 [Hibiscus sabdariffa]|uniref:Protein kinase domain-containing protein n=1 Tax=Hibiscus sabdariffa TaxID=183260 RepID=A0ABR2EP36_9ROSI
MLLEGLQCIHAKGYVHCDLKPENILVFPGCGSDVTLKIADFGLVRQTDENHTVEGGPKKLKFPGTPLYMPPETIVKRHISCALDIWSLGCVVLQMITGKQPWEGTEDEMDLAIKILFSTSPPNQIPKTLSDQGKDFLMKCFARERERWTADMLLSHPFITGTQEKYDDCLPSTEELEACLSFEHNSLTGTIPPSVGTLPNLQYTFLLGNRFSGTIPESLGNLTYLAEVHLSNNLLEGTIPSSLGNC